MSTALHSTHSDAGPRFARGLSIAFAFALPACSGGGGGPDASAEGCFIGEREVPARIELVHRSPDGGFEVTSNGASVPLAQPPQGGEVLLVGVRARNVACRLTLTASLRDHCDGSLLSLEKRPIELVLGASGWGEPAQPIELSNYANLPACPRAAATRNVQGEPYLLRLAVEDRDGRSAEASLTVLPSCAQSELPAHCECVCDQRYLLGSTCDSDPTDSGQPQGWCPGPDGG